jgi:hypothetical protein
MQCPNGADSDEAPFQKLQQPSQLARGYPARQPVCPAGTRINSGLGPCAAKMTAAGLGQWGLPRGGSGRFLAHGRRRQLPAARAARLRVGRSRSLGGFGGSLPPSAPTASGPGRPGLARVRETAEPRAVRSHGARLRWTPPAGSSRRRRAREERAV